MALVWKENLWRRDPPNDLKWPESRLVGQTTLDPVQAACAFASAFLEEAQAMTVQDLVLARKSKHRGDFLTYRAEFLHVASMLDARLLLMIIGQGGQVRSVELCTPGEKPRSVDEKEAQGAFADGALAIAVDFESTRTIKAYAWTLATLKLMGSIASLDFPVDERAEAKGPLADAVVKAWKGNAETRKRIQFAHTRLLQRGLW